MGRRRTARAHERSSARGKSGSRELGTYAPPDSASCEYVSDVLARRYGVQHLTGESFKSHHSAVPATVLLHAWRPWFTDLANALIASKRRVVLVWHSALAHFEMSELPLLQGPLDLKPHPRLGLVVCHKPLARALGLEWFPVPIDLGELQQHRRVPRRDTGLIRVAVLNGSLGRKNLLTQVAACRHLAQLLDSRIELFLQARVDPDLWPTMRILGGPRVRLRVLSPLARQAYVRLLRTLDLVLHVSHSETFAYCAFEPLVLGVPCVGSLATPALRPIADGTLCVADPTDPIEIAICARGALRRWRTQRNIDSLVKQAIELVNARERSLQQVLAKMEAGEIGWLPRQAIPAGSRRPA